MSDLSSGRLQGRLLVQNEEFRSESLPMATKPRNLVCESLLSLSWPSGFAAYSLAVLIFVISRSTTAFCHHVCLASTSLLMLYASSSLIYIQLLRMTSDINDVIFKRIGSNFLWCICFWLLSFIALLCSVSVVIAILVGVIAVALLLEQLGRILVVAGIESEFDWHSTWWFFLFEVVIVLTCVSIASYFDQLIPLEKK